MSKKLCPICNSNPLKGECRDSLSRKDNKTYICSRCGHKEALEDFEKFLEEQENNGKK